MHQPLLHFNNSNALNLNLCRRQACIMFIVLCGGVCAQDGKAGWYQKLLALESLFSSQF
jgi:hypothetical protein